MMPPRKFCQKLKLQGRVDLPGVLNLYYCMTHSDALSLARVTN